MCLHPHTTIRLSRRSTCCALILSSMDISRTGLGRVTPRGTRGMMHCRFALRSVIRLVCTFLPATHGRGYITTAHNQTAGWETPVPPADGARRIWAMFEVSGLVRLGMYLIGSSGVGATNCPSAAANASGET